MAAPVRRRLIVRLMLRLLALFLVLIPVLGGLEVWMAYQREADGQRRTLAAVAVAFQRPLADAVWNEDTASINDQIRGIARFPDVGRATLRADLGGGGEGPVFQAGAAPAGGATFKVALAAPETAGPHGPLGELELEADVAALVQSIKSQALGIFGIAALQVLGTGLLLIWAIRHLVARPIGVLARHVERLGQTLDTPPLPPTSASDTTEFAALTLGINGMQARLGRDFAELIRLKDELARHGEGLEALVAERTRELNEAKLAAETANRLKGQFLATVSHEIRTPMNAVIGFSHLLMQGELTIRQRDYVLKMQTATQSLLRMVNDILDFSRIEAGKMHIECVAFAIARVVHDAASVVQPKAQEKGLDIRIDIASGVPALLMGDPLRLGQVVINLMANAVKFTETGGVTVSVGGVERSGSLHELKVAVRDSGIGLNAAQIGTLFRAFSQIDSSTTRRFGGTGLGLAICRELVVLMGGEIGVDSEPTSGSVFWFTVPCPIAFADSAAADRPRFDAPEPPPPAGETTAPPTNRPGRDELRRAAIVERRLQALLADGDPDAGDMAADLSALLSASPLAAAAARVKRLAESFDFEDAATVLGTLRPTLTSWLEARSDD